MVENSPAFQRRAIFKCSFGTIRRHSPNKYSAT
jgi:hypothetical protein